MTTLAPPRLSRTLPDAPASSPVRIVHLGIGNFHRAHQAWYTWHAPDAAAWGIAAFTGRRPDAAELLQPQDGLYTLITRSAEGDTFELIGALSAVHPSADHDRYLDYLRQPQVAIVTITVTEAGYRQGPDGRLNASEEIAADIEALRRDLAAPVQTLPAKLVAGLLARREAQAGPITFLSCDNLPHNGRVTQAVVTELAERVDPSLVGWIEANVDFASSMVDRITPASTAEDQGTVAATQGYVDLAAVPTEPFSEWVISGTFPAGRPAWEASGAQLVPDVAPFEQRKLWLLNGSHSLLAYAGSVRGHASIDQAIADPACRAWVEQFWDEAQRHLALAGPGIDDYRQALLGRYANPRIRHLLAQIAADGTNKLAVRTLPPLRAERAAGRLPVGCVTALAAWVLHLRGHGAPVKDVEAERFVAAAGAADLADAVRAVLALLGQDLAADEELVDAVLTQTSAVVDGAGSEGDPVNPTGASMNTHGASTVGGVGQHLADAEVTAFIERELAAVDLDGAKVCLVVPDATRTCPLPLLMRTVHAALLGRVSEVTVVIALGTHQGMSEEHLARHLGYAPGRAAETYPGWTIVNHESWLPETFTTLGTITAERLSALTNGLMTDTSVPVRINRHVADADVAIVVGPVFPHEVVGFSGGNKYFFPGVSGQELIDLSHWVGALITSAEMIGTRGITPVRALVNEAATLIPARRLALCLVVQSGRDTLHAAAFGTPEDAWAACAEVSAETHVSYREHPVRRVLSIMPTKYEDIWTAAKGFYKLEPIVADGGEVIIYAPHITEVSVMHPHISDIGYHNRDYFLGQWERFKDLPWGDLAHSTHLRGQGTWDAEHGERNRVTVTLATGIPEDVVRAVNLNYLDPAEVDVAAYEADPDTFVEPHAGEVLYRLRAGVEGEGAREAQPLRGLRSFDKLTTGQAQDAGAQAIVVMGVSGSGKTTVASGLSRALGWTLAEADDFHPEANVAKMAAGVPLTDEDREPWLETIRDWLDTADGNVVITCSALRRRYRDTLRGAHLRVRFLHLDGAVETVGERLASRTDHFMPPSLLASQVATLEPLEPDEDGVAVSIAGTPAEIVERALAALRLDGADTNNGTPR